MQSNQIQCQLSSDLTGLDQNDIAMFGIGFPVNETVGIYPKSSDSLVYGENQLNDQYTFEIYNKPAPFIRGLNVQEVDCYKKLMRYFSNVATFAKLMNPDVTDLESTFLIGNVLIE